MARNRASFAPGVKPVAGFKPGKSGNPGGRPKAVKEVEALAREHTEEAMQALVDICTNERSPAAARVSAAGVILDRGWGKPKQAMELEHFGKDGAPLIPSIVVSFVKPDEQS